MSPENKEQTTTMRKTKKKSRKPRFHLLESLEHIPINESPSCTEYKKFDILKAAKIGSGSYGSVYKACRERECERGRYNYVAKIIPLKEGDASGFLAEAVITTFLGRKGICPKVSSFFLCGNKKHRKGVLIMQRLQSIRSTDIEVSQLPGFLKKISIMHDNGVLHSDLYSRNVLMNPHTQKLFIADFGLAFVLRGVVPKKLRATDVCGFLIGEPPHLTSGIRNRKLAKAAYDYYREELKDDTALLEALHMKVNNQATVEDPWNAKDNDDEYRIDCVAYYRTIFSLVAPVFVRQIGVQGIISRAIFCEQNKRDIEKLAITSLSLSQPPP